VYLRTHCHCVRNVPGALSTVGLGMQSWGGVCPRAEDDVGAGGGAGLLRELY